MGRGRAPCCLKEGLNKGPWTPEEDMLLISYIHKYGHGNWRALPKLAGLLRCGKSCRLRWINYLRPDLKRGNFTEEEEDTIIKLHELLGNKWSKIASCLPGRTDNEIKNVWNTHLKKRLGPKVQKSSNSDKEKPENPIEIPIAPMDYNDMLEDTQDSTPHSEPLSSSDVELKEDTLTINFSEISFESEIWNIIGDDDEVSEIDTTKEGIIEHQSGMTLGVELREKDESERWLAYLEKEFDLWGESTTPSIDPVASYFHA